MTHNHVLSFVLGETGQWTAVFYLIVRQPVPQRSKDSQMSVVTSARETQAVTLGTLCLTVSAKYHFSQSKLY